MKVLAVSLKWARIKFEGVIFKGQKTMVRKPATTWSANVISVA